MTDSVDIGNGRTKKRSNTLFRLRIKENEGNPKERKKKSFVASYRKAKQYAHILPPVQ